jgi:hypothetical protein
LLLPFSTVAVPVEIGTESPIDIRLQVVDISI